MIRTEEDDEFARIEMEQRIRNKSSGMECCTYDCLQGRDCPIRKQTLTTGIPFVTQDELQELLKDEDEVQTPRDT
jgi:hypothetical protein